MAIGRPPCAATKTSCALLSRLSAVRLQKCAGTSRQRRKADDRRCHSPVRRCLGLSVPCLSYCRPSAPVQDAPPRPTISRSNARPAPTRKKPGIASGPARLHSGEKVSRYESGGTGQRHRCYHAPHYLDEEPHQRGYGLLGSLFYHRSRVFKGC